MFRETAIISIWVLAIGVYLGGDIIQSMFRRNEESVELMFTRFSLSDFDGTDSTPLYLSILGHVFDVSKGVKHYGPGASYNYFVGKDATRNFVDGNFQCKKNCDDVTGLNAQEFRSLNNWLEFYRKNYNHVGKLIGKYYTQEAQLTAYGKEVEKLINKALEEETEEDRLKIKYPGCNLEWNIEQGTHVWCSDQSGGVKRTWVGVPRKFYSPGSQNHRCACISKHDLNRGNIKEYENCDSESVHCYFK